MARRRMPSVTNRMTTAQEITIISEELRIKDIEFTEKALEASKKLTRRGGQSLEMKKLKEEEACIEKVLALLQGGGDVRKGDWSAKEVCEKFLLPVFPNPTIMMTKGHEA